MYKLVKQVIRFNGDVEECTLIASSRYGNVFRPPLGKPFIADLINGKWMEIVLS
jgi:hypothetical protein